MGSLWGLTRQLLLSLPASTHSPHSLWRIILPSLPFIHGSWLLSSLLTHHLDPSSTSSNAANFLVLSLNAFTFLHWMEGMRHNIFLLLHLTLFFLLSLCKSLLSLPGFSLIFLLSLRFFFFLNFFFYVTVFLCCFQVGYLVLGGIIGVLTIGHGSRRLKLVACRLKFIYLEFPVLHSLPLLEPIFNILLILWIRPFYAANF